MDESPIEDFASPHAQRRLYERLRPRVAGFLRSRGLPPDDVTELTQETFLRVFQHVGKLRSRASIDPWVLRIAANLWKNALRSQGAARRSTRVISLDEQLQERPDCVESSVFGQSQSEDPLLRRLAAERAQVVRACVEELPRRMRNCLEMHYYQNRRQDEIASLLQISSQSVKSHIHQAKERLRECAHRKLRGGISS